MHHAPDRTRARPTTVRAAALALVGVVALVLAACGSDSASAPTTTTVAAPKIPFTAAEVTQDGTTFTVDWEAPEASAVTVYAGTDPEAVGRDREVGTGDASGTVTVTDLPAAPHW